MLTDRMEKAMESLRHDLRSIRTGRASPALLERFMVDYFNMPTPLQQLATISVPEAQVLLIRPYSPSDLAPSNKAIAKSDLGLTPNNDGQQLRLIDSGAHRRAPSRADQDCFAPGRRGTRRHPQYPARRHS